MVPAAEVYENVRIALATLRSNPLRSFLTVLGVVIGTTTVIVISAFVSGIDTRFQAEIESFGTRSLFIYKFDAAFNINPSQEERTRKPISYEDGMALRELPAIENVAVFQSPTDYTMGPFQERPTIRYRDVEINNGTVNGCTPSYFNMGVVTVGEGRAFTEAEDSRRAQVVVLGVDIANTLMPNLDPIGKMVLIEGQNFEVVGVLTRRDTFLMAEDDPNNENRALYMPYKTIRKFYPERDDNFVMATAYPGQMEESIDQVRAMLRKRRGVGPGEPDSFAITTADRIMTQFNQIVGGIFLLMVAISSVGLLVGGIGVMNIMLVSVTERTKEIGIRKAIGARRADIVWQFLVEAMTLTGFGGVLGVLLGWLLSLAVQLVLPSYVPAWAPIAGFTSSVAIGLLFGLWPAVKAARLDPIEALRYE
jgi:ABC-type antimicrobial peptide transport system permease subunit